jgi:hypothetical protein
MMAGPTAVRKDPTYDFLHPPLHKPNPKQKALRDLSILHNKGKVPAQVFLNFVRWELNPDATWHLGHELYHTEGPSDPRKYFTGHMKLDNRKKPLWWRDQPRSRYISHIDQTVTNA